MIERVGAWWRAALAVAMLATASLGGCSGTVVQAPCDAAVSDLVAIDAPTPRRVPMMATPRREPVDRGARLALTLAAALLVALAAAAAFGAAPASRREEGSGRPARSAEEMRLLRVLSQRWPEAKALPALSSETKVSLSPDTGIEGSSSPASGGTSRGTSPA